jgi:ketosteroid isomerase-like protein
VIKWNEEGKVIAVRDYLDTALIEEVWKEAEELGLF